MTFIIRLPFDTKPLMTGKTICVKITEWQLKNGSEGDSLSVVTRESEFEKTLITI
jgi:hypothetical protein